MRGDVRSRKTLERIGDYLGIGIANVIMGIGIARVIISGRLVYGWKFIEGPMNAAISGALEVAVEEYLNAL